MTTLITGGAGFVGSRLAARLMREGKPVVLLDNFNDYYDPSIKRANVAALGEGVPLVEGDIRDEDLVERLFNEHGVTRVAHLAAMAGVRASVELGAYYVDVNTRGSVVLMDAARKRDVTVFVQASTSSVYGHTERLPFNEADTAAAPLAPYPASKRAAELFGHSYHHLFGLNVTAVRLFNVYGPHGRPDMMPLKVIDAILNGETLRLYNGGDIKRDWTFVDDIVDGLVRALDKPLGFEVLNLGYGEPFALTEFIEIYEELIGKKAVTVDVPAPPTEPLITYCDNSRARELLSFHPQVRLPDGLAKTWEWYRKEHGL